MQIYREEHPLYNSSCCSEAQLHFHKNKETEPKHGTAMECHGMPQHAVGCHRWDFHGFSLWPFRVSPVALDRSSFSCEMIAQSFKFLFWQTSSMLVGQCLGDLYQKKYYCSQKQVMIVIGNKLLSQSEKYSAERKGGKKQGGKEGRKEGRKQASKKSIKEGRKE